HPFRRLAVPALALASLFAFGACGGSGGATPVPPSSAGAPAGSSAAGASQAYVSCPTSQPPALAKGETRTVTVETSKGTFAIKVQADLSPIAAGNFVTLAGCGFYDGTVFQRVATLQDGTPFVIQGG